MLRLSIFLDAGALTGIKNRTLSRPGIDLAAFFRVTPAGAQFAERLHALVGTSADCTIECTEFVAIKSTDKRQHLSTLFTSAKRTFMPQTSPKILIVDDNDLMRTLLRGILRSESCHVVGEARNGVLALELIEKTLPDVVFLDVMMPEMDGLEALQNIRKKHPGIRVIMITGNPSVENVQESIQRGASGFIVKPFNTSKVLDTLHKTLQTVSGSATQS